MGGLGLAVMPSPIEFVPVLSRPRIEYPRYATNTQSTHTPNPNENKGPKRPSNELHRFTLLFLFFFPSSPALPSLFQTRSPPSSNKPPNPEPKHTQHTTLHPHAPPLSRSSSHEPFTALMLLLLIKTLLLLFCALPCLYSSPPWRQLSPPLCVHVLYSFTRQYQPYLTALPRPRPISKPPTTIQP